MSTTVTTPENSVPALVRHTMLQAGRLLTRWRRDPMTVLQSLAYPVLLLLMLEAVLGRQVSAFAGQDALYGTVPMVVVMSALLGSLAGAVTLGRECEAGLPARLWVLPVHRASALASRFLAEAVRIAVTTVVVVAAGVVLGFRFHRGPLAAIGFLAVPVLFGLAFAALVTAAAFMAAKTVVIESISLLCTLMLFFNPGFVPIGAYPEVLAPVIRNQPMTSAVETMQALALGGAVQGPLVRTVAWSVALVAVCAVPVIRGYRRAL
ncbi:MULTISPECIES: ABC transporter permease [Rhodococcus]|uniref:Transport permease protein n=2 Tax=Rhodococcus TaxID=1827 RepID=M2ZZN6_9NOCA|nr:MULTISPECIES: ABC transporter permease [Rhodococcus]EME65779.1 ABC transporter membrane protein [Rhodococcus ruber BKS 20-38]KOS53925.1 peptide ABC transporter permease [Rhodococcus rhodochrous KG-21]